MLVELLDRPDLQDRPYGVAHEQDLLFADLYVNAVRAAEPMGTNAAKLKDALKGRVELLQCLRSPASDQSPLSLFVPWFLRLLRWSSPAKLSEGGYEEALRDFLQDCRAAGVDGSYLVWAIRERKK
jgi:hypothetical protein